MEMERNRVFERYTRGMFKKAAGNAYLWAIGEGEENGEDEGEEDLD
jgi:hypothetical protein